MSSNILLDDKISLTILQQWCCENNFDPFYSQGLRPGYFEYGVRGVQGILPHNVDDVSFCDTTEQNTSSSNNVKSNDSINIHHADPNPELLLHGFLDPIHNLRNDVEYYQVEKGQGGYNDKDGGSNDLNNRQYGVNTNSTMFNDVYKTKGVYSYQYSLFGSESQQSEGVIDDNNDNNNDNTNTQQNNNDNTTKPNKIVKQNEDVFNHNVKPPIIQIPYHLLLSPSRFLYSNPFLLHLITYVHMLHIGDVFNTILFSNIIDQGDYFKPANQNNNTNSNNNEPTEYITKTTPLDLSQQDESVNITTSPGKCINSTITPPPIIMSHNVNLYSILFHLCLENTNHDSICKTEMKFLIEQHFEQFLDSFQTNWINQPILSDLDVFILSIIEYRRSLHHITSQPHSRIDQKFSNKLYSQTPLTSSLIANHSRINIYPYILALPESYDHSLHWTHEELEFITFKSDNISHRYHHQTRQSQIEGQFDIQSFNNDIDDVIPIDQHCSKLYEDLIMRFGEWVKLNLILYISKSHFEHSFTNNTTQPSQNDLSKSDDLGLINDGISFLNLHLFSSSLLSPSSPSSNRFEKPIVSFQEYLFAYSTVATRSVYTPNPPLCGPTQLERTTQCFNPNNTTFPTTTLHFPDQKQQSNVVNWFTSGLEKKYSNCTLI
jgi:hypothetical protein